MNFVMRDAAIGRGRPKKHASTADRQKAYRQRKAVRGGIKEGVPVRYRGESGIVYRLSGTEAYVAFLGPPRSWRELPLTDLQIVGKVRKLPLWTDPDSPSRKHSHYTVAIPKNYERHAFMGRMDGVDTRDIPVYYKRGRSGRKLYRDWTRVINSKLAALVTAAKGRQRQ